jgi:hypothetical protein
MSRVSVLKRLFAVFVLPVFILAVVSFASAQEGKADVAAPARPVLMSILSSGRSQTSRKNRIPSHSRSN